MMRLYALTIGAGLAGGLVGYVVADALVKWRDGS